MNNSKLPSGLKDYSRQSQYARIALAFDHFQHIGVIPSSCSFTDVINNIHPTVKLLTLGDDDQFLINGVSYFINDLSTINNH